MKLGLWFKGLRAKLLLLSAIPASFLIIISAFSYKNIHKLEDSLKNANQVRGPLITYSGEMLLFSTSTARWAVSAMWNYEDAKERTTALKNVKSNMESFDQMMALYLKLPRSEKTKEMFKTVEKAWPELKSNMNEIIPLISTGEKEDAEAAKARFIKEVRPLVTSVINTIQSINDARKTLMDEELKKETAESENAILLMTLGSAVAITISLVFMFFVMKQVMSNLNFVTQNLTTASHALASASEQLSASSTEVASSSTETASSIQETVASLEEINSMVKKTDASGQDSLVLTQQTQNQSQVSETKLGELLVSLKEISTSAEKVTAIIQR